MKPTILKPAELLSLAQIQPSDLVYARTLWNENAKLDLIEYADIEADVREGVVTRVKATIEKAKSADARCSQMAADGQPCVAAVQKYYFQCQKGRP